MLTILLILAAAYVAARLYSSNQQKKPDFLLNDESPKQKFSELSGYWWFLLPIVSLSVLIYNTGAI